MFDWDLQAYQFRSAQRRLPYSLLLEELFFHNLLLNVYYQEVDLHNNQHKISHYSFPKQPNKVTLILCYCSYLWNNNLLIYWPCQQNKRLYRTYNLLLELLEGRFLILDSKYQHSLSVYFRAKVIVCYECLFCILLLRHLFLK